MLGSINAKGSFRYALARIQKKLRFSAIRDSQIHATSVVEPGSQIIDVVMERHSFCGYDCSLFNVHIGPFCSIADQVYIGGAAHPMAFVSTSPVFLSHKDSVRVKLARNDYQSLPRTTIGADVWIGFGARIKSGVTIGHGAVVGMGAIVTKDVAPFSIVGGNPAKFLDARHPEKVAERLLASRWWELPDDVLATFGDMIPDPTRFLDALEAR